MAEKKKINWKLILPIAALGVLTLLALFGVRLSSVIKALRHWISKKKYSVNADGSIPDLEITNTEIVDNEDAAGAAEAIIENDDGTVSATNDHVEFYKNLIDYGKMEE